MIRTLLPALIATALPAQNIINTTLVAEEGTVDLGPGYANEPARLYNNVLPGNVVRATEGDTLRVRLVNNLDENTILHVHGQPMRLGMDGTQRISRPETPPGQEFTYEFDDLAVGTYWYHPHSDNHHQLDGGMYGVFIVDPAEELLLDVHSLAFVAGQGAVQSARLSGLFRAAHWAQR